MHYTAKCKICERLDILVNYKGKWMCLNCKKNLIMKV